MIFIRSKLNPILKPLPEHSWESAKVYNPTVYYDDDVYHLYYRAVGKKGISSIGYAVSLDGEIFTRQEKTLLDPSYDQEIKGIEDPRITKVNDIFFLTYTSYDGTTARLSFATTKKLNIWHKQGIAFHIWNYKNAEGFNVKWDKARNTPNTDLDWSKAGAVFPALINKNYWLLFGDSDIWLAISENGQNWHIFPEPFLKPRVGYFDSEHVEMGPAPLKTEYGWLVIYHGIDNKMVYRLGLILLDLKDPQKILYRSPDPIFEPRAKYELGSKIDITNDKKPRVVFCCGAVINGMTLRIYYGAGDKYVCTATAKLEDLFKLLPNRLKNTGQ